MDELKLTSWRGKWAKAAPWCALIGAAAAGLAAFGADVVSIRESVIRLFSPAQIVTLLSIRDVRADEAFLEKNGKISVAIEYVVEKTGGKITCMGGLLMNSSVYPSIGMSVGGKYVDLGGNVYGFDSGYLGGGYFGNGSYADPIAHAVFGEGQIQQIMGFDFEIPKQAFNREARFRLDCKDIVTPWIATSLSDPGPH